jgi:hypothetical protein
MQTFSTWWRGEPEEPEEPDWWDSLGSHCSLSRTQRFYGFGICFALGSLCSFLSAMFLPSVAVSPENFALTYSLGNLISMCSTAFLMGPAKQLRNMFQPVRAVATTVYILTLALTLIAALELQNPGLTLLMLVIQFAALCWYCLSYIPYGREVVTACFSSTVGV